MTLLRRLWLCLGAAALVAYAGLARAEGEAGAGQPEGAARSSSGAWRWLSHFHPLLGVEGGTRSFRHREPTTGETRPYDAKGFSGVLVGLALRPPHFRSFASWSLEADYWHSIAFSSWSRRERGAVPSPSSRVNGLARLLLRTAERPFAPVLGIGAGFGRWTLDFELPESPMYELATGNYSFVRARLDVRQPLWDFAVFGDASYLQVVDAGPLGNRQVQGSPQGTEASVGVSYTPFRHLELKLRFARTLFVGELAPLRGRADLPAAIRDEYLTLGLSAVGSF